jgi:hypothetical protein
MTVTVANPTQTTRIEVKYDFVVNEITRIKIPAQQQTEPQNFRDMSKIQRQLIVKRLIDHIDNI